MHFLIEIFKRQSNLVIWQLSSLPCIFNIYYFNSSVLQIHSIFLGLKDATSSGFSKIIFVRNLELLKTFYKY